MKPLSYHLTIIRLLTTQRIHIAAIIAPVHSNVAAVVEIHRPTDLDVILCVQLIEASLDLLVLGNDPRKIKVRDDLEPAFQSIKARYQERAETITGEELYAIAGEEAAKLGYEWGSKIAGHLVGDFPHERIPKDKISLYITPGSTAKMSSLDKKGHKRHWILHQPSEKKNQENKFL